MQFGHNEDECFMSDRSNVDGFDLSASEYDDIFTDHQRIHELSVEFDETQARLQTYLRQVEGLEEQVMERGRTVRMMGMLRLALELKRLRTEFKEEGITDKLAIVQRTVEVFQKADSLSLEETVLTPTAEHYTQQVELCRMGLAPFALTMGLDAAKALFLPLYANTLRVSQKALILLAESVMANINERYMQGVPDWDFEQGSMAPSSSVPFEMPAREGEIAAKPEASAAQAEAQVEDESALLARLLGGLNI